MTRNIDLNGTFVSKLELTGFIEAENTLVGTMHIPSGYVPIYDGDYEAIPTLDNQIFPTMDKKMIDDFEVKATPMSDVRTVDTDGYTITIL